MSQSLNEGLGERKGSKDARERWLRLGKTDFDLGLLGRRELRGVPVTK
jgi:hypothetical protein